MSRGQSDKPLECRAGHAMSTEAGIDVQQELEDRIHEFRTSAPPMPVVVVHAEDDAADGAVFALVKMECIGLATGGVRFSDWLSDKQDEKRPMSAGAEPSSWTVAELEEAVHDENVEVREVSGPFVTVVYAGPLSSDPDGAPSPVKGIEELAGVHVAQKAINDTSSRKLRVLVANGGVDMQHQVTMADKIAAYADTDPTLIGVVGIGRNPASPHPTTGRQSNSG